MKTTLLVLLLFGLQLVTASFPLILIPKSIPLDTEEKISVTSLSSVADDFDFEVRDSSVQSELFHRSTFSLQPSKLDLQSHSLSEWSLIITIQEPIICLISLFDLQMKPKC